jgi:hypothetical protein
MKKIIVEQILNSLSESMEFDALLSSWLDPLEGLGMLNCEKLELGSRSRLPTLKGVRGAC